jgi:hypothetical protein
MSSLFEKLMHIGLEFFGRYYSTYRAYVVSVDDPLNMDRIYIYCPTVHGSTIVSILAYPKSNWGGKNYGVTLLPEVGDVVFVEFDHGDPSYPIWQHGGYGKDEKPEEFLKKGLYGFKTPKGNTIIIEDIESPRILVKFKNGQEYIELKEGELQLESTLIKLGTNGDERAVMGETNLSKLTAICEKLEASLNTFISHTHPVPNGTSGPPTNSSSASSIKGQVSELRGTLNEILSNKVKIDKGE